MRHFLLKISNFHCALLTAFVLCSCGSDLSEQSLEKWRRASESAKNKFIAAHFADDAEHVRKCITRMAALPNTDGVRVLDAGEMCSMGLRLREKNAAAATGQSAKSAKAAKPAKKKSK
jgi:hypothetical protein